MKRLTYRFASVLLSFLAVAAALTSCMDELEYPDGPVPEGMTRVSASLDYEAFNPALHTRASGTAIKEIKRLWVVVYKADGSFVKAEDVTANAEITTRRQNRPDQGDPDPGTPGNISQTEETTGHAEFQYDLPNGEYRIYAVANHDLSGFEGTEKELRERQLTWEVAKDASGNEDVSMNSEMFGFFSTTHEESSDVGRKHDENGLPVQLEAPKITLRGGNATLYSWIRRAASKLTIVYDGSRLNEDVTVFIKSVTIKDIPSHCLLGETNSPQSKQELMDSPVYTFYTGTEPKKSDDFPFDYKMKITRGGGLRGAVDEDDESKVHLETHDAYYFYENCQGVGKENTLTDKRQDISGENKQVTYPGGAYEVNGIEQGWKDGKPYGSYVEILGYYKSKEDGEGPIIYRFMLGKDHITDYNAERNYHYKLTMKFNKKANDVDFHIVYVKPPKPSHQYPEPYYISYLYNHQMYFPYAVSTGNLKVSKIELKITENPWWPDGANTSDYYSAEATKSREYGGFLSLRDTRDRRIIGGEKSGVADLNTELKNDYDSHNNNWRTLQPHSDPKVPGTDNEYRTTVWTDAPTNLDNAYKMEIDTSVADSTVYKFQIPFWTRQKQLIKKIAYTGNNPYDDYRRIAKVSIRTTLVDDKGKVQKVLEGDFRVIQVERVVNPKGIYRSSGSTEGFHAVLKARRDINSESFYDIESDGPWRAYIYRGNHKNGFSLSPGKKSVKEKYDFTEIVVSHDGTPTRKPRSVECISGSNGSKIDFNINFHGIDDYAIVWVDYNDYTCHHLIYLREGMEPMELLQGGCQWHSYNVRWADGTGAYTETDNPCDEGSLFRYNQYLKEPIDASSNVNPKSPWVNIPSWKSFLENIDPRKPLGLANKDYSKPTTSKKWVDIGWTRPAHSSGSVVLSDNIEITVTDGSRVATFEDYQLLYNSYDIENGYGVLYFDGAKETQNSLVDAYEYLYSDASTSVSGGKHKSSRGMRGIFVYNKNDENIYGGRSIFFPIGNSGNGQRKHAQAKAWNDKNSLSDYGGLLKYAMRNDFYPSPTNLPLFYDIWRRPGAVYFIKKMEKVDADYSLEVSKTKHASEPQWAMGWDVNYFTFDFFPITYDNLYQDKTETIGNETYPSGTNACFVRLVDP